MQLFESQMQVELAQSTVRAQVVKEYEEKMLEMERRYQARLREEVRPTFLRACNISKCYA
jgi:RNase P subunit RPR2